MLRGLSALSNVMCNHEFCFSRYVYLMAEEGGVVKYLYVLEMITLYLYARFTSR